MFRWIVGFACVGVSFLGGDRTASAYDTPVDVELIIAVDVSGSMSDKEHNLQRQGFLAAFEDEKLIRAIQSGPYGQIAVTYAEWANFYNQQTVVPWRLVKDRATALAFRDELASKPRSAMRGTSISGALEFSARQFADNRFQGLRRVIDVSGDGTNRTGPHIEGVRDQVLKDGIVINGLPIMISPTIHRQVYGYDLANYFEDCVIGGPGAFVYPVYAEEEMTEAIRRKLIIEVSGQPARVWHASQEPRPKADCHVGHVDRD